MLDALQPTLTPAADRHIAEPLHTPAFWQAWLCDCAIAQTSSAAEQLADASRLCVVAPHPDDELLMCAGLMQEAMAQGTAIAIVSVTDGEACFGGDAERATVATIRRAEARDGLQALGAQSAAVHRLAIPDGEVAAQELQLQGELQALLQPGDLVVAPWRLDGHPDHDATGRAAGIACARNRVRLLEAPVWMWHWARPDHPAIPWHRLCTCPLPAGYRTRKRQALNCHKSQLTARGEQHAVVDSALQARAHWPFEVYFLP